MMEPGSRTSAASSPKSCSRSARLSASSSSASLTSFIFAVNAVCLASSSAAVSGPTTSGAATGSVMNRVKDGGGSQPASKLVRLST